MSRCNLCKNNLSSTRLFIINNKTYCNEHCFKLAIDLNETQLKLSKVNPSKSYTNIHYPNLDYLEDYSRNSVQRF